MPRYALCAIAAVALLATAPQSRAQEQEQFSEAQMISGTTVHVRAEPNVRSPIIGILPLGRMVAVPKDGQPRDTTWIRVRPPDGTYGFIRADLIRQVPLGGRAAMMEQIATERFSRDGDLFPQRAELFALLNTLRYERLEEERAGRVAVLWIRSMHAVMTSRVAPREREAYEGWHVVAEDDNLIACDARPNRCRVKVELLRELHDKYLETTSSDELAWMLHEVQLRGPCVGYAPCYFEWLAGLDAEYLRQHPEGAHAPALLKRIVTFAREAAATPGPSDWFVTGRDCESLMASTLALRQAVEGTSGPERDAALAVLQRLRERCEWLLVPPGADQGGADQNGSTRERIERIGRIRADQDWNR